MKTIRNLMLFFVAATLMLGVSAQNATTTKQMNTTTTATKTEDKVNTAMKGPNGETVYTGPKGGNYYMGKTGNKVYIAKDKVTANKNEAKTEMKTETTMEKKTPSGSKVEKTETMTEKTVDKVNKDKKGPNGETVYTGPKGGNYYMDKTGKKVYLKK